MTLVDEARQHELIAHLQDHLVASKRAGGGSAANSIIGASYFGCKNYYSCGWERRQRSLLLERYAKCGSDDT